MYNKVNIYDNNYMMVYDLNDYIAYILLQIQYSEELLVDMKDVLESNKTENIEKKSSLNFCEIFFSCLDFKNYIYICSFCKKSPTI